MLVKIHGLLDYHRQQTDPHEVNGGIPHVTLTSHNPQKHPLGSGKDPQRANPGQEVPLPHQIQARVQMLNHHPMAHHSLTLA